MIIWVGQGAVSEVQSAALEAAGFYVETVAFLANDTSAADDSACDAVILASPDFATTLRQVATHRGRSSTVIAMVSHTTQLIDALKAGADDAVFGDISAEELVLRARIWRDRAHVKRENLRLLDLAFHDELTGLGNRRSLHSRLEYALEYAARHGGAVSTLVADLDGMKRLNDTQGHAAGDDALKRFGAILSRSLRTIDLAARTGGDEFAVVLPSTDEHAARRVAERIRKRVETLLLPDDQKLTVSFGIAAVHDLSVEARPTAEDLLARADRALYAAKRGGKNRVEIAAFTNTEAS